MWLHSEHNIATKAGGFFVRSAGSAVDHTSAFQMKSIKYLLVMRAETVMFSIAQVTFCAAEDPLVNDLLL